MARCAVAHVWCQITFGVRLTHAQNKLHSITPTGEYAETNKHRAATATTNTRQKTLKKILLSSPCRGEEQPQQQPSEGGDVGLHLGAVVGLRQQRARRERSQRGAEADSLRELAHPEGHEQAQRHESFRAPGAWCGSDCLGLLSS